MADDIVTSLRDCGANCDCYATSFYECVCEGIEWPNDVLNQQAADEIKRLRAAGDALAAAHADDLCDCNQPECVAIRAAHDAWQEARRG